VIKLDLNSKLAFIAVIIFLITVMSLTLNVYGRQNNKTLSSVIDYNGSEMILIPAGDFWMGSQIKQGDLDEHPQHRVYLDNYYIDKYEVTNKKYCDFLNATGKHRTEEDWWIVIDDKFCLIEMKDGVYKPKEGCENYPVISVTWEGANRYAEWSGRFLPTEAEWEKAAKGKDGYTYPWGMNWDVNKCNNRLMYLESVTFLMLNFYNGRGVVPPGSIPEGASPYGVTDMAGNVMEWCADWYDENYYEISPYKNPRGPETGTYRVIRGGSWENSVIENFRCSNRFISNLDRGFGIGFRCVLYPENL